MNLIVTKNKKDAIKKAAKIILDLIQKKPNAVLGLATGSTMIPLYKELIKLYNKKKIDFSKVKTFNLDEYSGIKPSNKNSYHYYMNHNFFNKININRNHIHFPTGNGKSYDSKIKKAGGLDLCVLGIGRNGHIAFDEPGSSFKSVTRKVKLSEDTRKVNSRFFKNENQVPHFAYTMGIQTILNSKKIILLAFGNKKSDAIARAVKDKITEQIPASILRRHKYATIIIDKNAAKQI